MEAEAILGLAIANLAACLTPGQNTAMVAATGARYGWAGGLWATFEILIAEAVWTIIALLAIAGAVALDPGIITRLDVVCGIVLLLFGLSLLLTSSGPAIATGLRQLEARKAYRILLGGLVIGLANPMALLFSLAVLPLFVGTIGPWSVLAATGTICVTSGLAMAPYLLASSALLPRLVHILLHRAGSVTLILMGVIFTSGMMR